MKKYQYEKEDKIYTIKKGKLKYKKLIEMFVIPGLIFTVFGILFIYNSIMASKGNFAYNEKGNADYKVYLKENTYYDQKYLGKDMQYIASLINTINADFKYELDSTEKAKYSYDYKIIGTLKITDKTNLNKVLYSKEEVLLKETSKEITSNNFAINEDIDIDYDKYNEYVSSFRKDYALSVNALLELKMIINVEGQNEKLPKDIKQSHVLKIDIPMSEQTINIGMTASSINNNGVIPFKNTTQVRDIIVFTAGCTLLLLGITELGISIYIFMNRYKMDPYQKELRKILKNYDTYIVNASGDFKEGKNIVRVETFEELLDAQNMEQSPIVFYEVEPGNKSYFVIKGAKSVYRFTLTKAYQDKIIKAKKVEKTNAKKSA